MVTIFGFEIINGSKSELIPDHKEIHSKKELEEYRSELEKEYCYKEEFGELNKFADITFKYNGWGTELPK